MNSPETSSSFREGRASPPIPRPSQGAGSVWKRVGPLHLRRAGANRGHEVEELKPDEAGGAQVITMTERGLEAGSDPPQGRSPAGGTEVDSDQEGNL